jgi:hypothetical protein
METGYDANGVARQKKAPAITLAVYQWAQRTVRGAQCCYLDKRQDGCPRVAPTMLFPGIYSPVPCESFPMSMPSTANVVYYPPSDSNWMCSPDNPYFSSLDQCVAAKMAADNEYDTATKKWAASQVCHDDADGHDMSCDRDKKIPKPTYPDPLQALSRYQDAARAQSSAQQAQAGRGSPQAFVSMDVCFIICIGVTLTDEGLSFNASGFDLGVGLGGGVTIGVTSTKNSQSGPWGGQMCAALGVGACVSLSEPSNSSYDPSLGAGITFGVGVSVGPTYQLPN